MVKEVSQTNVVQLPDEDDLGGRPPHVPTQRSRAEAEAMASHGVSHRAIASILDISVNTLRKHYMKELTLGDAKVQVMLGQTAVRMALGAPAELRDGQVVRAEIPPNKTLLIFLLKTRLGLTESININDDRGLGSDAVEFNTAGLTQSERVGRLTAIFDAARARRDRRAVAGERPVGSVPGKTPGDGVPE